MNYIEFVENPEIYHQLKHFDDPEWEIRNKLEILRTFDKFSFSQLETPYKERLVLQFDNADVEISLVPTLE